MQSRFVLMIASAAALLVLLVGTGFAMNFNSRGAAVGGVTSSIASGSVQVGPVSEGPSMEQQVQSLLDSRETAYRQALDDANSKLQQANAQLQQAYAIIDTLKQAASTAATPAPAPVPAHAQQAQPDQAAQTGQPSQADPAPSYAVSPDEAAAIALIVEPSGRLIRTPDLVNFQGTPAYEVQLDSGTVYVDANSRSVLYDAAAPVQSTGGNLSNRQQEETAGGDDND